jgi:hypothetical protein
LRVAVTPWCELALTLGWHPGGWGQGMVREHWRELGFWRWWWINRVPPSARLVGGLAGVLLALGGGFLAADRLASANAGLATGAYTFETTVDKVVTVRENRRLRTERSTTLA